MQKTYKGKDLLVLKIPYLICNKERQTEPPRGTERIGDSWISITPSSVFLKGQKLCITLFSLSQGIVF